MYYRSITLIRVQISLCMWLVWKPRSHTTKSRTSCWSEGWCLSVMAFQSNHPQGTKEPYRTPGWLDTVFGFVFAFDFLSHDGRQRLTTLFYLFQKMTLWFLSIYCSAVVLSLWESGKVDSKSENFVQIFNLLSKSRIHIYMSRLARLTFGSRRGVYFWKNMNFWVMLCA